MLDLFHMPTQYGNAEISTYFGYISSNVHFQTWQKPRGKSMIDILLVGDGGNGGNGVVGAVSTAAGGGGGGSGSQTRLTMPLHLLPDTLFILLRGSGSGNSSRVAIYPDITAANCLAIASGGGNGGAGSGATAGTAGTAGAAATNATMPLGWAFATTLIGQAGTAGGTTGGSTSLNIPTTGLLVTGGTGGAGLGAAGSTGTIGATLNGGGVFPSMLGGTAGTTATTPAGNGTAGYRPVPNILLGYGGTGGGSTHGSATGAGLYAGKGGDAAPGCGGGGGGGGLTGSTQGTGGLGGPAFCIITCW